MRFSRVRSLLSLLLCLWISSPAIAAQPRIVALAPNIAELVYAAGAGDQLVGVVAHSDYPAAVRDLPLVGDAFRVDYEVLRQLQPDIVMVWESGTPQPAVDRLISQGFRIEPFEPRSLEDIPDAVERIGKLAGTSVYASRAAARLREDAEALRARYTGGQRLSVFYQISANPWFTVSSEHVISEVLDICGGDNVFGDVPGIAPAVSLEAILRSDPDVVIAGAYSQEWVDQWQQWQSVTAVTQGALYTVNPDLVNRATPRFLEGAAELCAALEAARQ